MHNKLLYYVIVTIYLLVCRSEDMLIKADKSLSSQAAEIGGKLVHNLQYPYIVQVVIQRKSDVLLCGGLILSKLSVLTAAHCFIPKKIPAQSVNVYQNSERLGDGPKLGVRKIINHVDSDKGRSDISLLQLRDAFNENGLEVAYLPPHDYEINPKTSVKLVGWLATSPRKSAAISLIEVKKRIIERPICKKCFENDKRYEFVKPETIVEIVSHLICAQNICDDKVEDVVGRRLKPCNKETVGFLIHQNMVIGSTTFNLECSNDAPEIYTKLSKYTLWIGNNMATDIKHPGLKILNKAVTNTADFLTLNKFILLFVIILFFPSMK